MPGMLDGCKPKFQNFRFMAADSADLDQMSRSVASYSPNSGSLTLYLPGTACFFVCLFGGWVGWGLLLLFLFYLLLLFTVVFVCVFQKINEFENFFQSLKRFECRQQKWPSAKNELKDIILYDMVGSSALIRRITSAATCTFSVVYLLNEKLFVSNCFRKKMHVHQHRQLRCHLF